MTETDASHPAPSSIVRQIGHTLGTKGVSFVCRAGLVVVLGRSLSTADYGAYSLITTVTAFAVVLVGLSLHVYVYRAVPGRPREEQLRIFKATSLFEVAAAILVAVAVLGFGGLKPLLVLFNAEGYDKPFAAGLFLLILMVGLAEVTHFLMAQSRIEVANWVDVLSQAAWVLPFVVLWFLGATATPFGLVCWQIAGCAAALIFAAKAIGPGAWWNAAPHWESLRVGTSFSVPLIIESLSVDALRLVDRSMLSHMHGLKEVGVYAFAFTFVNTLYTFTAWAVFKAFGPRIFAAHNTGAIEERDLLQTYMIKASLAGFVVSLLGFMCVAGPLIRAIARPDYAGAVHVLPLLGLSYILMIVSYPAHYVLLMQNRVKTVVVIDLIGMAVAVTVDLLLIPHWSYMGAATGSIAGYATVAVSKYIASDALSALRKDALFSFGREVAFLRQYARF